MKIEIAPGTIVEGRYAGNGSWGNPATVSTYRFSVNGKDCLDALVDNEDPELRIRVGAPAVQFHAARETGGIAVRSLHEVPSTDGSEVPDGIADHIDGLSIYAYVMPRLLRFVVEAHVAIVLKTD